MMADRKEEAAKEMAVVVVTVEVGVEKEGDKARMEKK